MEVFRRNAQPHISDMRKGGAWGNVPNKHRGFVRVFRNAAQSTVLAIFSAAFHAAVLVGFIADFFCVMREIGAMRLSVSFMPSIRSTVISLTLRRDALSLLTI